MKSHKPPKTFDEQVERLISRGMRIDDSKRAKRCLSHFHHLTIVRNHCAHHARIWNREFIFLRKLPRKRPPALYRNFKTKGRGRIYDTLVMLGYLMDQLGPNTLKKRLYNLLKEHPNVAPRAMGFPKDWLDRPFGALSGIEFDAFTQVS